MTNALEALAAELRRDAYTVGTLRHPELVEIAERIEAALADRCSGAVPEYNAFTGELNDGKLNEVAAAVGSTSTIDIFSPYSEPMQIIKSLYQCSRHGEHDLHVEFKDLPEPEYEKLLGKPWCMKDVLDHLESIAEVMEEVGKFPEQPAGGEAVCDG